MILVTEGQEYRILITQGFEGGKYTKEIYKGIAESDTEAQERIEGLEAYYACFDRGCYPVQIVIDIL